MAAGGDGVIGRALGRALHRHVLRNARRARPLDAKGRAVTPTTISRRHFIMPFIILLKPLELSYSIPRRYSTLLRSEQDPMGGARIIPL